MNKSSIEESDVIVEDFYDEFNNNYPHKIGFKKDFKLDINNYFNASLHCLTNIYSLSYFLLKYEEEDEYYIPLFSTCYGDIDKEEIPKEINNNLNSLKNHIFEELNYNKTDYNPKNLIYFILNDLKNNKLLPDSVIYNFQYKCDNCQNISKNNELKFIEFNIPKIIEFYDKKNKITIYDCFHYYFKSILNIENSYLFCEKCHKRKFEVILKSLQKDLIIFIDYGEKKEFNMSYEFDEIINFKDFTFLNKEDRNKEFFLSTLIACKNMGNYFETFYTMARNNENTKYNIYNGIDVRPNIKVSNKLKKEKIDLTNIKESWPVVLVYSDKNKDIEIN